MLPPLPTFIYMKELKIAVHKKIDILWIFKICSRNEIYHYFRVRYKRNFHISNATKNELEELLNDTKLYRKIQRHAKNERKRRPILVKGLTLKEYIMLK